MGNRPGRPPKGKPRGVRWEDPEWEDIQEAADAMGLDRADFIRNAVARDVKWVLRR